MKFSEHTKIRSEKFGTVVFDTLTEKIFVTDTFGTEILQLIEQGKDVPQIVSELSAAFDGDAKVMEKDIIEFTDELRSNNIITV